MNDTLTGKTIGKYQILNKLGSGGMAEVYKGYQENLDRYVAIKFMHAFLSEDQDFLHRFKREARAMASLRHPNIVRVFDFDTYGDSYYLVMEYIEGGTLKERLAAARQAKELLPLEQARQIAIEMADALAYAHDRGMIHRDIKPANIMVDRETGKAVLTDFGIVKLAGGQASAVTVTGALIGTPAYMSPEQALGEKGDTRADIYSLGIVLFQMVTGRLPFDADTPLAVVMKQVNDPAPLPMDFNPNVPLGLQEVILKSLAKNPDDRYQTAAEMAAALRAVRLDEDATAVVLPPVTGTGTVDAGAASGATVVVAPPDKGKTAVAPPAKKRPAWLWAAAGLLLLLLLGGGALFAGSIFSGGAAVTPTAPAVVIAGETDTPEAAASPMEMDNMNMPTATPNLLATQVAELAADATRRALPTDTPPPTNTPTATPIASPTPDATAQFLLTCEASAELLSVKAENYRSNAVITNQKFNAEWALRNNGECPWPAGSQWVYVEGETFGYEGEPPVLLAETVNAGAEIILKAPFTAPATAGSYESVWQLQNPDGEIIGAPLKFEFRVFPPATATPAATNTPTAVPTSETVEGQADWIFTVDSCEYIGSDWRCQVTIIPYIDGSDATGQFTVFVFDQPAGQATTFRGTGPFIYFAQARRCAAFNQTVRVVDDVTATEVTEPLYIHPNDYFPGGCTEN